VVLPNLGGPDGPESVQPFLRNLFRDPAIIQAPFLIREGLAWLISTLRGKSARANYAKMGGGSPLLPGTIKQADALKTLLEDEHSDLDVRVFPAMRYWNPFTEEVVAKIKDWGPDQTVILPLYPQFSTTTTGSSLTAWKNAGGGAAQSVCCYPTEEKFLGAHKELIEKAWSDAGRPENVRVLLSAHGLPEKIVEAGDPYPWQVKQTAEKLMADLPQFGDWQICYQSRVGPMKWISPSTDDSIIQAGEDGKHILLVPIAFVSEHIETLVELDEEYALLAEQNGVLGYTRVPALGTHPLFIKSLGKIVMSVIGTEQGLRSGCEGLKCPSDRRGCPHNK
jgi:ferrochelatase